MTQPPHPDQDPKGWLQYHLQTPLAWIDYCVRTLEFWRQYPLRTLLGVVLVVLAIFGVPKLVRPPSYHESKARTASQIDSIKSGKRDSLVRVDPRFVGDIFGDEECVARVQELYFFTDKISSWRLGRLSKLPNVRRILLYETYGTDTFLKRLGGMEPVQSITFSDTDLSSNGAKHLATFPNLKTLYLSSAEVDNAGLQELKDMTGLQRLDLSRTPVTNADLQHLKGLTGLTTLSLEGTPITDAGVAHLKGLTGLKVLNLKGTKITDAALAHIVKMTGLETLNLENTVVTDEGLEHQERPNPDLPPDPKKPIDIEQLTNLRGLYLYNTPATNACLERLRKALPRCKVTRYLILTSDEFFDGLHESKPPKKKAKASSE